MSVLNVDEFKCKKVSELCETSGVRVSYSELVRRRREATAGFPKVSATRTYFLTAPRCDGVACSQAAFLRLVNASSPQKDKTFRRRRHRAER